jgi:hypothetical protein
MTVGYWDARSNQTWGLDWHRNEGIELTYLARGKIAFAVDKTDFQLITRPSDRHSSLAIASGRKTFDRR